MFNTSFATHVSSCANRQQLVPPLQPCRARLRRNSALSLQPSLRNKPLVAELPDVGLHSSSQQHEPPNAPAQSVLAVPNTGQAAARQLLPRTAAWVVGSAKAKLPQGKISLNPLPLLGAAVMLGVACCVMPVAGVLACILLLSGIAIMDAFWKKLMPDHLDSIKSASAGQHAAQVEGDVGQALCAASTPGLQPLAHAPAEVSAWLRTVKRDIWGALWQPLLDYREEWQEAMMVNGPYAWAYDASGISIGQLAPEFTGVQVLADPSTGAIAAVEADMSLDTSKARDSVLLEVLARGPIGKYAFSLQDARVIGRVRIVPVHKHSLLLVRYVDQPAVQVELSTAYPTMLPHNRTKLLQVEEIEDLLQETLQGVLGSPDNFRLNSQAEFPANMQYAAESAVRAAVAWVTNSRSRLTAALQQRMPLWAAVAAAETKSDSTDQHQQAAHSLDAHSPDQGSPIAGGISSSVSSEDSNAQHVAAPFSMNDASTNEPSMNPKNSSVGESAVLALAAQQAAWRQQKPQGRSFSTTFSTSMQKPNEVNGFPLAASGNSTLSNSSNAKQSRSDGDSSHSGSSALGTHWQLSSTYSEAMECWTASGITARLSAAAAEAAAIASPTRQDAPATGATTAAAALKAQVSTGRLLLDPVQAYSRSSSSSSKPSSRVTYAAGRQHTYAQPGRAMGSYAVLSTTSAAGSGTGVGLGSLLYDFGSLGASCVLAAPSSHGAKIATDVVPATCSSCAADSSAQADQSSSMRDNNTAAAAAYATSSSGSAKAMQVNSNVPTRQMQPQVASTEPTVTAAGAFQAFCAEPAGSPSSLSAGAGAAAMALPAPRPEFSWVSIAASVSVVVLGSGILLGSL